MKLEFITVVYRVVDETEFRKTNPLNYKHDGLEAVTVGADDLISKLEKFEEKEAGR